MVDLVRRLRRAGRPVVADHPARGRARRAGPHHQGRRPSPTGNFDASVVVEHPRPALLGAPHDARRARGPSARSRRCATATSCGPTVPASCAPSIGSDTTLAPATTEAGAYPPLYYLLVGWPSRLLAPQPAIYAMRMIGALLAAALLASGLASATQIGRRRLVVTGAALALTPMALYLAGVVNPNGLEIAGAFCLWLAALDLLACADRSSPGARPDSSCASWSPPSWWPRCGRCRPRSSGSSSSTIGLAAVDPRQPAGAVVRRSGAGGPGRARRRGGRVGGLRGGQPVLRRGDRLHVRRRPVPARAGPPVVGPHLVPPVADDRGVRLARRPAAVRPWSRAWVAAVGAFGALAVRARSLARAAGDAGRAGRLRAAAGGGRDRERTEDRAGLAGSLHADRGGRRADPGRVDHRPLAAGAPSGRPSVDRRRRRGRRGRRSS